MGLLFAGAFVIAARGEEGERRSLSEHSDDSRKEHRDDGRAERARRGERLRRNLDSIIQGGPIGLIGSILQDLGIGFSNRGERREFFERVKSHEGSWARGGHKRGFGESIAREMLRRNPSDRTGWFLLAKDRSENGSPEETIEAASKALEAGEPDPELYQLRASAYYKQKLYDAAYQDALAALKLDSQDRLAYTVYKLSANHLEIPDAQRIGQKVGLSSEERSSSRAGSAEGEQESAALALKTASAQSAALNKEAAAALSLGDAPAALRKADAALKADPRSAQALNLRAMAQVRLGRSDAAIADASKALEIAPGSPALLITRAWAYGKSGDFESALKDASAALEAAPSDGAAHFVKAFSLAGLGRRAETLEQLREAAAASPAFREVYDRALHLPEIGDAMLLFSGPAPSSASSAPAQAPAPARRGIGFIPLLLAVLVGGFLIALGLMQNVAGLRERWTRRGPRVGARPEGSGFWKRFEQVRELGAGGMGRVYEAVDLGLRRRVAVKRMREEILDDPRERKRFIEEARTAALLRHPNIVTVHAIEEEGSDLYIVFEFVEGRTLAERLREQGALSSAQVLRLGRELCSALAEAHGRGVVHRDLKPANILMTPEGSAKIADFGLARRADSTSATCTWSTPDYAAPEQEEGRAMPESDLYALGVCLLEARTGRRPFEGLPSVIALSKREGRFQIPADIPESAALFFRKALDPLPEKRFRSAREFSEALERSLA